MRDPRGGRERRCGKVAEAVIGDDRCNGGEATEEERISAFDVNVEVDETAEECEEITDGGENVGQCLLSSPKEGLSFNRRGEVIRLLQHIVRMIPRALLEMIFIYFASLWREGG